MRPDYWYIFRTFGAKIFGLRTFYGRLSYDNGVRFIGFKVFVESGDKFLSKVNAFGFNKVDKTIFPYSSAINLFDLACFMTDFNYYLN